jgi:hypothetical protein
MLCKSDPKEILVAKWIEVDSGGSRKGLHFGGWLSGSGVIRIREG